MESDQERVAALTAEITRIRASLPEIRDGVRAGFAAAEQRLRQARELAKRIEGLPADQQAELLEAVRSAADAVAADAEQFAAAVSEKVASVESVLSSLEGDLASALAELEGSPEGDDL